MIVKNKYLNSDKKCFILGTGPSLEDTPLEKLEAHFTIGVNLILNSGFVPNVICVSDRDMINDNYNMIIDERMKDRDYLIVKPKHQVVLDKLTKLENVKLIEGFKETGVRKPFLDPQLQRFAMTSNGVINDLAVSLAVYLGFKQIHLLGADGRHGKNSHFYDHSETQNRIESIVHGKPNGSEVNYNLLMPILKELNVELFNCSVHGNNNPEIRTKNLADCW
tara:strand:+ start:2493 stop:3155 length:663 start_codon:yes stop_codon:yes gene_type:complete